jgi:hypothetical protein
MVFLNLFQSGLSSLASYLAAHVLLCLLPAFAIAGGMSALIPKEAITRFLGRRTPKIISYPAAAAAGSLLAVCSCTIVPLFAGIYKKGAGLGPAITFLFFAPAANILALAYTGVAIGPDLALARLILALAFGIGVGIIMALIFQHSDTAHDQATDLASAGQRPLQRRALFFLLVLVMLLVAGTLKISALTATYLQFTLVWPDVQSIQANIDHLVPYSPARGEEGLSIQGIVLISMLAMIAFCAWQGFEKILDGFNYWSSVTLALISFTLLIASLNVTATSHGLLVNITGRTLAVIIGLSVLIWMAWRVLETYQVQEWLWEAWRFVKQIFPLLIVGVFAVGAIRQLIRPEWIESLAGRNTLSGNLAGVLFGVFMYFPTLVEVPIAKMFINLGMHRGPLLAYLMADPELSLQSILIISAIIGKLKAWTYVAWVALFSTLAGIIYGFWVDGVSLSLIALFLMVFLGVLSTLLWWSGNKLHPAELPRRILTTWKIFHR